MKEDSAKLNQLPDHSRDLPSTPTLPRSLRTRTRSVKVDKANTNLLQSDAPHLTKATQDKVIPTTTMVTMSLDRPPHPPQLHAWACTPKRKRHPSIDKENSPPSTPPAKIKNPRLQNSMKSAHDPQSPC